MPRHRTTSSFCVSCRLRLAVCICGSAPRLDLATRVVMVIHAVEWRRPTNTGHLTRLALANAEIRLQGLHHRPDLLWLRRNVLGDRRSTFEAVAQTLGLVEGPETEQRLLGFLAQFLRGKKGR